MTDAKAQAHDLHLDRLEQAYSRLLPSHGYDAVLIYSGEPHFHFADDQAANFATYAHFLHWAPLPGVSHSWLLIRPGQAPLLRFHAPADFWHLTPRLPEAPWTQRFVLETTPDAKPPSNVPARLAILGDVPEGLAASLGADLNPPALVQALDELRVHKSDYEIECIAEANRRAYVGHRAASEAFEAGVAELDIQLAYLGASRQREADVPYQNIVGLNTHAGVLHYQHYDVSRPDRYRSLLLDAGCREAGYAADITRTWAGKDSDPRFEELIEHMHGLQWRLIEKVHAGVPFPSLHHEMHLLLGQLLFDHGLTRCSAEASVDSGITRAFCPHGLGHLLGLQVHDVGGRMSASGEPLPPPERDPALRLTRDLEAGMVVTVEPGLYFIPMLLDPLRNVSAGRDIDWIGVSALMPHGGIRIEDNLVVTVNGFQNLTRVNDAC